MFVSFDNFFHFQFLDDASKQHGPMDLFQTPQHGSTV